MLTLPNTLGLFESRISEIARIVHDVPPFPQLPEVLGRLAGHYGVSDENNALKMGFDPIRRRWPDWMQSLGLPPGMLPRVHPVATPLYPLSSETAAWTSPQSTISEDVCT